MSRSQGDCPRLQGNGELRASKGLVHEAYLSIIAIARFPVPTMLRLSPFFMNSCDLGQRNRRTTVSKRIRICCSPQRPYRPEKCEYQNVCGGEFAITPNLRYVP